MIAVLIAEPGPPPATAGSSAVVSVDQSLRRTDHRLAASRPRARSPTAHRWPVTGERDNNAAAASASSSERERRTNVIPFRAAVSNARLTATLPPPVLARRK